MHNVGNQRAVDGVWEAAAPMLFVFVFGAGVAGG